MEHGKEVMAMQCQIDALMLEHCPDEMTCEQIEEWARHQQPVSDKERFDVFKAIGKTPNVGNKGLLYGYFTNKG